MGWRRRSLRILVRLALAAVGVEAVYVIAINVFLSTALFDRAINATPDAVDIHYARGWSLFPTRVHAEHLSIRGTDSHVEWILRLDRVEFECSLVALFRKEFRVTMARGSGLTFRMRFKVASPADTPEFQAGLPAIDSLGPVGLVPDEPPYEGEWDDRRWQLWTVSLTGIDAERVREIWLGKARFTGDARVTGGFYLKPIRRAEVGPAIVTIRKGAVTVESRVVVDRAEGEAVMALASFDPRADTSVVRSLSLSLDGSLVVPDIAYLASAAGMGGFVAGELDVRRAALRIDSGVLRDGSRLRANAASLALATPAFRASGAVEVEAAVDASKLRTRIVGSNLVGSLSARVPRAELDLDSSRLALDAPFGDLHAVLDLPEVLIDDASRLREVLPAGRDVRVDRGTLAGAARVEGWRETRRITGWARVRGEELDVSVGPLRAAGCVDGDASVATIDLDTYVACDVRTSALVHQATLAASAAPSFVLARILGLRATATASELSLADPLEAFDARLDAPALELFDPARPGADDESEEASRHTLRLASGGVRLAASATLSRGKGELHARVDARARSLGVLFAGRRITADVSAHAEAHADARARGPIALDGARVVASHVVLARASMPRALVIAKVTLSGRSPSIRLTGLPESLAVRATVEGARAYDLAALDGVLPGGLMLVSTGRESSLDADVDGAMTSGVLRGVAHVHSKATGVASPTLMVGGDARVVIDVRQLDLARRTVAGRVGVDVTSLSGGFGPHEATPDFVARSLSASASVDAFDLSRPASLGPARYELTVDAAHLVDARALNVFVPPSAVFAIESGRAYGSLHLSGDGLRGRGDVEVRLADGGVVIDDTHVRGDFDLSVRATSRVSGAPDDGATIDLEGSSLSLRHVRVTGASTDTTNWSGDLRVGAAQLAVGQTARFDADVTLAADDANPLLGVLFRDTLSPFVAGLTRMSSLAASMRLEIGPGETVLSRLSAKGATCRWRGRSRSARRPGADRTAPSSCRRGYGRWA